MPPARASSSPRALRPIEERARRVEPVGLEIEPEAGEELVRRPELQNGNRPDVLLDRPQGAVDRREHDRGVADLQAEARPEDGVGAGGEVVEVARPPEVEPVGQVQGRADREHRPVDLDGQAAAAAVAVDHGPGVQGEGLVEQRHPVPAGQDHVHGVALVREQDVLSALRHVVEERGASVVSRLVQVLEHREGADLGAGNDLDERLGILCRQRDQARKQQQESQSRNQRPLHDYVSFRSCARR
jgi:hypothetical protein